MAFMPFMGCVVSSPCREALNQIGGETTGHNACVAFDKETPAPLVVLVLMTPGVKGIAIIDSPSPVSPMGFHAS